MLKSKLFKRKLGSSLHICILLTSIFVSLLALVPPAGSQPPWYDSKWNFRKTITLNHTMVNSTLENFPALIDITDTDLKKAQLDGDDIIFIDANNTKLNHEIEFFDSKSSHMVAWVNIPMLSSTEDATFYMYYGNPSATNQQNASAVWDSSSVLVQHLEETGQKRFDSTVYGNAGTAYGGIAKSSKIDGADNFDGVNDYVQFADSPSLNPSSAITIELWMNLSLTGNYTNLVNKGTYNQYYLRLGLPVGRSYWHVKFSDGTSKNVEGQVGWVGNAWHYLVASLDTTAQTIKVYLDGVQKLSGTFASGKNISATANPVLISDPSQRRVKGNIDEVRISSLARSPAWIQTTYKMQKSPSDFCSVGFEETNPEAVAILASDATPADGATGVYTNPTLSIRVIDLNGKAMNITFREKVLNNWIDIKTYLNVSDGVYTAISTNMKNLGTTYYWGVYVTDGQDSANKTFSFTTTTKILEQKWVTEKGPYGVSGVLAADVNGDGVEEVIHAGRGGVICLNGTNGAVIWNFSDNIGSEAQAQMADLNHDGIFEVIVPLEFPAGILALHANNGTEYWRKTGFGGRIFSSPVVFDIDGNGYPTIFVGSTDVYNGLQGTGRVTSLSYNGTVLHQIFSWRPCSGGLSIADTDGDAKFELYMGDRHMYLNDPEYGDNDYGRGAQSFWAENLTLRWSRPEILCSSHIPMLADVNKDGVLDVIVGDLNGGVAVLNSTDGSTIKMSLGIPNQAPVHYQPSVYDIDGDGNLELLMADYHDWTTDDLVVWDLVKWQVDARFYLGKDFYGPQVADVDGDGKMEIIACNFRSIFIIKWYNGNYHVIDGILGLSGEVSYGTKIVSIDEPTMLLGTLNYAVVQDIDGDGYNELVVSTQSGSIYAFDTPARRPNPRPRSEVQFYSELRLGAAEYVQPQGGPAPVVSSPYPSNLALEVPVSLSELRFSLTDYQHDPMNYTVTTYPDIGSATVFSAGNRMYTVNVSELQYSTTYAWIVSVTDGPHWANATYTFTTQSFSWWNTAWQHRKAILVDHNKVVTDLENLPIVIDITDIDLCQKAQPDGKDIVFTDINGVKLNHEIELYDNNTGHLVAWVRIPLLSSASDTKLYMYYGNSEAENQQNSTAVWDSSYMTVQHLEENGQSRYDSTGNGNDGTAYGGIVKGAKIDGADVFDGVNDYVMVANDPSLSPSSVVTIELWMNLSLTGKYINLVNKGNYGQYYLRLGTQAGNAFWYVKFSDGTSKSIEGNVGWTANTWHYIIATLDTKAQIMKIYLDGVQKLSGTFASGKNISATANPVLISDSGDRRVKGVIDEVRISNIARPTAWIKTSYNNQKDPATFCTKRNEETIPEAPVVFNPSPPNKAKNVSPSLSELSFNIIDCQGDLMNYTVKTYPDIGSDSRLNVINGRYIINISNLQYFTTYSWIVNATDGTYSTIATFSFSTCPNEPPTQDNPILVYEEGNIVCYNQTTYDLDGNKVTNIYSWYKNNISITNLLLPLDTNSSTTVKDYSGYNNNGVIVRGVSWTNNGKVGGAYKFDRGFIEFPETDALDGGGLWSEITVEHWIYLPSFAWQGNTRTIARIPSYEIGISGNRIFAGIWIATGNPMISGYNQVTYNVTQTNTWYHVALTYKSGVGLTLYVNGIAAATKTGISGNIQPSGTLNPLYIGWFDYFKGIIDEVRIYPKSLSPQQIYQRYNETKDGLTNSSTIVYEETNIGDVWRCEVTPNDSHQDGTTKTSNTITIGYNNKPTAKDLTITPTTPRTNDNLTATYTFFDPDGDLENVTMTEIRWYRNGTHIAELDNKLIVPYYLTTKGDIWYFTVKPSDGKEYGTIQTSPPVLIQNIPPTAIFTESAETVYTSETIAFNASESYDPDGTIASYFWDFGDGINATGITVDHAYLDDGNYTVTLTVTDNDGATNTATASKTVLNRPPVAIFTESSETAYMGQPITFNASDSYDLDGYIVNYFWDFGDGTNTTGVIVDHSYAVNGTFTVTLTVTDDDGETALANATKTIFWNALPVALFTESAETVVVGQIIYFNASQSYDPDGSITNYFWDFGDGTSVTGVTVEHAYADNGVYIVTLTVTDNYGATASANATKTVEITPPVASFTESAEIVYTNETITFNASSSYDSDGTIVSFYWNFGDGTNATGMIVDHAYAENGTCTVTLTVTDDDNATDTETAVKTILNRPPIAIFTESAETVYTNETITFNASSSYDPDGLIISYFWDFGDETNATGVIVEHAYADDGNYTVTLTVTDDDGTNATTSATKNVLNRPPVASFTYSPASPIAGETVTFNASSSYDPDGFLVSYRWDFGDGNITTVTDPIINHAYSTEGNYTAILNVTDNQALSDSHSITLEVRTAGATYQTLSHTRALFARPILVTFISLLSIVALLHTKVRRAHYSRLLSKARTPRRRI